MTNFPYFSGPSRASSRGQFGQGNGLQLEAESINDLNCAGTEDNIFDCVSTGGFRFRSSNVYTAGVICSGSGKLRYIIVISSGGDYLTSHLAIVHRRDVSFSLVLSYVIVKAAA